MWKEQGMLYHTLYQLIPEMIIKSSKKFIFPSNCPSCGSKTIKDYNEITKKQDAVRRCASEGYDCEKIAIEKIKHFVSKDAFNIDGLGKKIVENFWNLKLIKFPYDIINKDYKKIEELEDKLARKLLN